MEASLVFEPLTDGTRYDMTDWQSDDIDYLSQFRSSANWSEMGTYKTSTGLWLIDKVCRDRKTMPRVLIITSKGGKGTYFDAIPKCLPEWRLFNLYVQELAERVGDMEFDADLNDLLPDLQMGHFNQPTILLAHYDCFTHKAGTDRKKDPQAEKALWKKLAKIPWTFVLVDEAHRLKNKDTQWTINIKKMRSVYRHIMTGTGFVNRPDEMWSLLDFLKEWDGGYWKFRTHFCEEILVRNFRTVVGLKRNRVEEFRELRKRLGPRRMMADVHAGIGHPIESVHEVDLNPTQTRMYNEIKAVLRTLDQSGEPITSPNVLSQLNRLRQISVATPKVEGRGYDPIQQRPVVDISLIEPSSKLDEVMDILSQLEWAPGEAHRPQAVVFSCFRDPLSLLAARLDKADIPYLHMQQKHNDEARYRMWHDTFPLKQHKVFMSTLALGGESINLSSAQYLIFLDRSWSPKDMMQAVGRVYRPGQTAIPEIIYINARINGRKTVDSYIKERLDKKGKWFDEIFGA